MTRFVVAGIAVFTSAVASITAAATIQRTFVSGHGNDAYPCTLTQPCRQFAAALAKTGAQGEVVVLDSAGYGPVIVSTSVSIVAPAGVYAGISVFSGNGVVINGANVKVTLRGLSINGQGGATGILFQQGAELHIDDCTITNMGDNGIDLRAPDSRTTVKGTVVRASTNSGLYADAFLGKVAVEISKSTFEGNQWGVYIRQGATVGVRDSTITGNTTGLLFSIDNPAAMFTARGETEDVTITSNTYGLVLSTAVDGRAIDFMVTRGTLSRNLLGDLEVHSTSGGQTFAYFASVSSPWLGVHISGSGSAWWLGGNNIFGGGGAICQNGGNVISYGNNVYPFVPVNCTFTKYPLN